MKVERSGIVVSFYSISLKTIAAKSNLFPQVLLRTKVFQSACYSAKSYFCKIYVLNPRSHIKTTAKNIFSYIFISPRLIRFENYPLCKSDAL